MPCREKAVGASLEGGGGEVVSELRCANVRLFRIISHRRYSPLQEIMKSVSDIISANEFRWYRG